MNTILPPPIPGSLVSVDGVLSAPLDAELPQVCVSTGSSENLIKVHRKLSWHPTWVAVFIMAGVVVYIVLALVLKKTTTLTYYISKPAKECQFRWHMFNWVIFGLSFASIFVAAVLDLPVLVFAFPTLFLASLIIYFKKVRLLYAKSIDSKGVLIGGIPKSVIFRFVQTE